MKINKCSKLICNLDDKNKYVVQIRLLKQGLDHGIIFKKVHRVIQLNQEAWLEEYISDNIKLRKEAKNDFEKDFFKLMNNSIFGKTVENVRKHRVIKVVTTEIKTKWFSEKLLAIEMKKIKVKINKPIYLGLSILDISKTLMYKF